MSIYRLNVVTIRLPPLRERPEDIPDLARFFLERLSAELGVPRPPLDAWDICQFQGYPWPGDVRELRNVIERCLLLERRPGQSIAAVGGAEMPDVDSLGPDADYSGFLSRAVSPELRYRALARLFAGLRFNVTDGLDDDHGDFTRFAPLGDVITADMRHQAQRQLARELARLGEPRHHRCLRPPRRRLVT